MFGNDRESMRRFYVETWQKVIDKSPLQPLEALLADVIALHPEYHKLLQGGDKALHNDYTGESDGNPFMHMGLHIALREQVATNRPSGITALYNHWQQLGCDMHNQEHAAIECLAQQLWLAQSQQRPPDEAAYLGCLQQLPLHK